MKLAPQDWPTRQQVGYALDQLHGKLKKPVRKAATNKWGSDWLREARQFVNRKYGYTPARDSELDLHLALLLAKAFWNLPQVDSLLRTRHQWAHQRPFNRKDCEDSLALIQELYDML